MSESINSFTLIVNRKVKPIPPTMWQMVAVRPAYSAVQIMQPFGIVDEDGYEQHGTAGDYIVKMASGACIVISAALFSVLFTELAVSA